MRTFSVLCLLCTYCLAHSQPSFNRKHRLKYAVAIFANIAVVDSNIYTSGLMKIDTPFTRAGFFAKLNLSGDTVLSTTIADSILTIWWQKNMKLMYENKFLIAGDSVGKSRLILIDTSAKVLKKKAFYSYFAPASPRIYSRVVYQEVHDSSIWVVSQVDNGYKLDYIQLTKFSKNLDSLSKTIVGMLGRAKVPTFFDKIAPNRYLISGYYTTEAYLGVSLQVGDFFIEIDSAGKVISEYYTPDSWKLGGMGDMLISDSDSSYVICGSKYQATKDDIGFYNVTYSPMIYKMSANKQIIWQTNMGIGAFSQVNELYRIKLANQKDGYVFCGKLYHQNPKNIINLTDGVFGKVSLKGDSLWLRRYRILADSSNLIAELYDLQSAPDGGYYLSGSTIGGPKLEDNYQGGWLVKVDQHGCLVPGCHLPTSLPLIEAIDVHYKVFPNPVQADLNIFVDDTKGTDLTIRFCDALGVPLKSLQHRGAATSYILPLQSYASGTYIVQFWQDGRLVKGEKVVLAR